MSHSFSNALHPDVKVGCAVRNQPWHLYRIYSIPNHEKHKWLLLQFIAILMMDAKGARNMYSILVVVNKHNTARVASFWFIIYYQTRRLYKKHKNI